MTLSSILFICLGNICRSPMAEGVLRHNAEKSGLADKLKIDSAGIGSWHVGNRPDRRAISNAASHGVDISKQVCRQLRRVDFQQFDLIFGMDNSNVYDLKDANIDGGTAEIALFAEWAGMGNVDIPDPYYGGDDGFEIAWQMINQASELALERLGRQWDE